MVRVHVPGSLLYRELAMGVVRSASRIHAVSDGSADQALCQNEFEASVLSAFGEAFNNIARHGGQRGAASDVEIEIQSDKNGIVIQMIDWGQGFDPQLLAAPMPPELAESGMGLFIIKSFMDEVEYRRGRPNVLYLRKRRTATNVAANEPSDTRNVTRET